MNVYLRFSHVLCLAMISGLFATASAQSPLELSTAGDEPVLIKERVVSDNDDTFQSVEIEPSFVGGPGELFKWIAMHIVYPLEAAEAGIQGKVIVSFVVEKDGSLSNVRVIRSRHPALDREAVRVVKNMPKWIPGQNNGVPVRVTYNVPITFKLQD